MPQANPSADKVSPPPASTLVHSRTRGLVRFTVVTYVIQVRLKTPAGGSPAPAPRQPKPRLQRLLPAPAPRRPAPQLQRLLPAPAPAPAPRRPPLRLRCLLC